MNFPYETPSGLIIHSAANPVWGDEANSSINLTINAVWPHVFEDLTSMPFCARSDDSEEHGRVLFEFFKDQSPAPYERPDVTVEDLQADLDKLMPDVMLGLATDKEISLAKTLRLQIKAMSE